MAKQRNPFSLEQIKSQQETEAYMDRLRKAAFESVQEDDVKQIMQALLKRAKEGDPKAVQMVMDQLLGMQKRGGDTYSQTNVYEAPLRKKKQGLAAPAAPTRSPTSAAKPTAARISFQANGHG